MSFSWTALASSPTLSTVPCYNDLQCARLTVPLQYSDPSAGEAQIALLIAPSTLSADDPEYRGPLLLNPGGPASSGVEYLLELGTYFREVIGPQYDLVGFDPRGVGATTPLSAFLDSPVEALDLLATYPLSLNESASSFGRAYALGRIMSDLAEQRNKLALESVSTPAVAMDMLAISRAFGFEKLNYWGVSYGSVLGATFAAMFPDRVGRVIIDGIVNSHEWYAGIYDSWLGHTEDALTSYYDACVAAGPDLCALYANSSSAIRSRVTSLLDTLHTAPVPASHNASNLGVVDAGLVLNRLFQTLFEPFSLGQSFAAALVALEAGNPLPVYEGTIASVIGGLDTCDAIKTDYFTAGFIDTFAPIACGDSVGRARQTLEDARAEYDRLVGTTGFWSVLYGLFRAPCSTWNVTAKDTFNGTFTTNTSEPILVISNTLDPSTPIDSGRNMSAGFTGSVLLEQNSTGHTSLSGFSTCTALAIRAYFASGTLPAPHTVCQPDTRIFESQGNSSAAGGVTFPAGSVLNRRETAGLERPAAFEAAVRAVRDSRFLSRHAFMGRVPRGAGWRA
ncbi:hypothetical protein PHLGIDRAFT_467113 [Phlebiopsis gigantea 11061_1 CR5-6]|uniref:Uncharacterized protein n=1 Tax=Phlebiopsis gigantea (strain 11061_1 CR5-6) TaxID=745531 RepID=A0A0C3S6G6_PHLG1|nr:hypothetical protein PHLGIDRAFT_467113 [Phlebiopsis gigantea 11061_1 CR5-6]